MEIDNYIVLADKQLVLLALEGDAAAFETLFNRYRDAIFKLCCQRTGGQVADANDLVQETFVKVWLNLHRYDPEYTFGQWVYTIARNAFIDYVRKRRDDLSIDTLPAGQHALFPVSSEATPEERFIDDQRRVQLEVYLGKMTPRYRRLIELRFFRGYTYEEIAARLELPIGTVKTQIHRAREQLCRLITAGGMMY